MSRLNKKIRKLFGYDITGYLFVAPFIIGVIFFFLKPMMQTVIFSFHEVTIEADGFVLEAVGLKNYDRALFRDGIFIRNLFTVFGDQLIQVAAIMVFSVFVALLLIQNIKGRLFFRVASFLPVIFASEAALFAMEQYQVSENTTTGIVAFTNTSQQSINFLTEILTSFGFPADFMEMFVGAATGISSVAWSSGLQIVLFIIGLKSIPQYLYEVCEIEGATKWEVFWKITFPLLSPSILLCFVYTLIKELNAMNLVVEYINDLKMLQIHYACTVSLIYTVIIYVILLIMYKVVSKKIVYLD